jgi:hypothetical protein
VVRYKTCKVRGKWTETLLTQKYVTFVLILIVNGAQDYIVVYIIYNLIKTKNFPVKLV